MISTGGAIVCECKVDGRLYKQAYKRNFIIITAILGLSTVVIALEILAKFLNPSAYDTFLLVCFCILFALGAFLLIINLLAVKNSDSSQKIFKYEIYSDCMFVSQYDNGVKLSEVKTDCKTLFRCRETKDYFLAYVNRTAFYPISKEGLTPQEQNAVRKLFKLRILQGAGMAEIYGYKNVCTQTPAEASDAQEGGFKGE